MAEPLLVLVRATVELEADTLLAELASPVPLVAQFNAPPSVSALLAHVQGVSGPPGPQGEQGEPGPAGVLKYAETLVTSATSYEVQHGLGTLDVTVAVYCVATGECVFTGLVLTSEDIVTVSFAQPPQPGEYRVVVQG